MAVAFLIICGVFWLLYYVSKKYDNPYKLTFIFGKKGAGKSCLMVNYMLKYKKRGWNVYTDMKDIYIPGVRIIDSADLASFRPAPHSALFLDEVGISMDNRNYKSFPPGLRDFFKYVRKMKCVVYLNSQSFDVDKKVRDTTDSMILQVSLLNCISLSRPIRRSITLTEPSAEAESRIADKLSFAGITSWKFYWMPHYYKYFNSLEMPARSEIPYSLSAADSLPVSGFRSFLSQVKDLFKSPSAYMAAARKAQLRATDNNNNNVDEMEDSKE